MRLMETVAMLRNSKKPHTSVKVVTTTADATAGSMPMRRIINGTAAPTEPARIIFPSIANPTTIPRARFCFQTMEIAATRTPSQTP